MQVHNVRQRSPEWYALRKGIPTTSNFNRIILPSGKRSGQARRYLHELAYERLMDKTWERDLSNIAAVQHGITMEDRAVEVFQHHTGAQTQHCGFITNDSRTVGCSPDRLIIGTREALEVKCPTGPVQVGYLMDGVEEAYKAQLQGQLMIGGFACVHFFAWSEELPFLHAVVEPDRGFMSLLNQYLVEFTDELERGVKQIKAMGGWPANVLPMFPPDDAA